MKKIISILLFVSILLGVTGCSKSIDNGGKVTNNETSSKDSKTAKDVKISFITQYTDDSPQAFWEELVANFEKENPHIKVELSAYPDTNTKGNYIKTLFATNQLPDISFAALDDLKKIDGALLELPSDLYAVLQESAITEYNGKVVTMPAKRLIMPNVFYNKDVFAKFGLEIPSTFDEFVNVCKVLKENGMTPIIEAGQLAAANVMVHSMLTNMINEYDPNYEEKMESGELKLNDDIFVEIATKFQNLWTAGYYHEGSLSFSRAQILSEFEKGEAAMLATGSWDSKSMSENATFNVGWFSLPGNTKTNTYPILDGNNIGVSARTKHPEEAFKFIEFFFRDENYVKYIPTLVANLSKTNFSIQKGNKVDQVIADSITDMDAVSTFIKAKTHPSGFPAAIKQTIANMAAGSDVKKELDALQKLYDELKSK